MDLSLWHVFLLSMLPVTELRAAIPLAAALGMTPWQAYCLAVSGNIVPIIPVMLLLNPVAQFLGRFPPFNRVFQYLLRRTRKKSGQLEKYGLLGLMLFVALPVPGTGAWTGAILAWLFGLRLLPAVLSIGAGVILAGVIVTLASYGIVHMAVLNQLDILFIIITVIIVFVFLTRKMLRL